jgi:hypothetical protein
MAQAASDKVAKREPPIKLLVSLGGMKTLADGTVAFTVFTGPDQLMRVTALMNIKQSGDQIALTARRVKVKKKKPDANQKTDEKKKVIRRVRRYPYHD